MSRRNPRNDEVEQSDQSQITLTEGALESFSNNSVSITFSPDREYLAETLTRIENSTEQTSIGNSLVALLREKELEVENLKVLVSDLTTANASLRTQNSCGDSCQIREELENIKTILCTSILLILPSTFYLSEQKIQQLSDKNCRFRTQIQILNKKLSDEEDKNRVLSDENSSVRQEVTNLRIQLDIKEQTCQKLKNRLSERKTLNPEKRVNRKKKCSREKSAIKRVMSFLRVSPLSRPIVKVSSNNIVFSPTWYHHINRV